MSSADKIAAMCESIKEMLLEKNEAYGDSALDPVACFAHDLTPVQRMGVRIDDKISRLMRGGEYPGDDTIRDLAGYLILLLIAREKEEALEQLERPEPNPARHLDDLIAKGWPGHMNFEDEPELKTYNELTAEAPMSYNAVPTQTLDDLIRKLRGDL